MPTLRPTANDMSSSLWTKNREQEGLETMPSKHTRSEAMLHTLHQQARCAAQRHRRYTHAPRHDSRTRLRSCGAQAHQALWTRSRTPSPPAGAMACLHAQSRTHRCFAQERPLHRCSAALPAAVRTLQPRPVRPASPLAPAAMQRLRGAVCCFHQPLRSVRHVASCTGPSGRPWAAASEWSPHTKHIRRTYPSHT